MLLNPNAGGLERGYSACPLCLGRDVPCDSSGGGAQRVASSMTLPPTMGVASPDEDQTTK